MEQLLLACKRLWLPVAVAALALLIVAVLINRQKQAAAAKVAAAYEALQKANETAGSKSPMQGISMVRPATDEKREAALQSVVKDFAGLPAALEAELLLAKIAYDKGDFSDAVKRFQAFHQQHASEARDLAAVAMLGEGDALMEQQMVKEALAAYQAVAKPELQYPPAIVTQARMSMAMCQAILGAASGDQSAAKATLNDLLASTEDTFAKTKIQQRLRMLDLAPASFWQDLLVKPVMPTMMTPQLPMMPAVPDDQGEESPAAAPETAPAPTPAPANP